MEKDNLQLLIDRLEAFIDAGVTFLERLICFKLEANERALRELAREEEPVVDHQAAETYQSLESILKTASRINNLVSL